MNNLSRLSINKTLSNHSTIQSETSVSNQAQVPASRVSAKLSSRRQPSLSRATTLAPRGPLVATLTRENTTLPVALGLHQRLVLRAGLDHGDILYRATYGKYADLSKRADVHEEEGQWKSWTTRKINSNLEIKKCELQLTEKEVSAVFDYLESRLGEQQGYNIINGSCRNFSANQYDHIERQVMKAREDKEEIPTLEKDSPLLTCSKC
jgi:hypothetical protein